MNFSTRLKYWVKAGKLDTGGRGCWLWHGCKNTDGYPKITVNGNSNIKGHRYMYAQFNSDENIEGKVIRHKCDNPLCMKPSHLESGTTLENVQDRVSRGRDYNHVTSQEVTAVVSLRNNEDTYKVIAKKLGITAKRVEYILKIKVAKATGG